MTDYTPLLAIPQVAPGQNQKEATINTGMAILEAAMNDSLVVSLDKGATTLTPAQFTRVFLQVFDNQTAATVVTLPATKRWFGARNDGQFAVTLKLLGVAGFSGVVVAAGACVLLYGDGSTITAVSQGVSKLADLSDVAGGDSASAGQVLGFNATSGFYEPRDLPADVGFFTAGAPSAGQTVLRQIFARSAVYYSDLNASQAHAGTPATASAVFHITKNGQPAGTITFAPGAAAPTYSTDTGSGSKTIQLAPGDLLAITAPVAADATLADVTVQLRGVFV